MPDGYWANFLSVLFVGRAPDDLRRQYRLPPGRRKGANGSAPSTNHCRVISLCSIVPAPHNASLQANLRGHEDTRGTTTDVNPSHYLVLCADDHVIVIAPLEKIARLEAMNR